MSLDEQDGKLVACSCNSSFVGLWVVDLNKIKPFSGPAIRKAPEAAGKSRASQAGLDLWALALDGALCAVPLD